MTTIAIIQARMASSRLPGKVLKTLGGAPVLARVVRAATSIRTVDKVIVATSTSPADDAIETWCSENGVASYRGSEEDVLRRYCDVAANEDADVVLRLTADCPLIDPSVCEQVLALLQRTNADYACNTDPPTWPDGLDCWAVTRAALERAGREATRPSDREHVLSFIRNHRNAFQCEILRCPLPDLTAERWTLDTPKDFEFLSALVEQLPPDVEVPGYLEVLRALDSAPELRKINADSQRNEGFDKSLAEEGLLQAESFEASGRALERALKVIPLGAQTFSRSHIQFPEGQAPLFLTHGDGGHVWDVDGNEYVDLVCGLMPVLLGYRDPDVDEAITRQLARGITFSLATELEAEVAEKMVRTIPCAEMVRFGKNGSDATTGAVRVARAATGRNRIAVCGYHGWHDWYVGATSRNKGIPESIRGLTQTFQYNDLSSLEALFAAYPGEFAAVVLEPMNMIDPDPGFLESVAKRTREEGAVLVFDEIITGFRFANGGAQELFGVTPDLATFGKAMGNGMPIAAVVGRSDLMAEMEEVFFSSTFGGEALSLTAANAVLDKVQREPVVEKLWQLGAELVDSIRQSITENGLDDVIRIRGKAPWTVIDIADHPDARKEATKTALLAGLNTRGVLTVGVQSICYAHTIKDVWRVVEAYNAALPEIKAGIDAGTLEENLKCPVIEPVFKVR